MATKSKVTRFQRAGWRADRDEILRRGGYQDIVLPMLVDEDVVLGDKLVLDLDKGVCVRLAGDPEPNHVYYELECVSVPKDGKADVLHVLTIPGLRSES